MSENKAEQDLRSWTAVHRNGKIRLASGIRFLRRHAVEQIVCLYRLRTKAHLQQLALLVIFKQLPWRTVYSVHCTAVLRSRIKDFFLLEPELLGRLWLLLIDKKESLLLKNKLPKNDWIFDLRGHHIFQLIIKLSRQLTNISLNCKRNRSRLQDLKNPLLEPKPIK